jgi:hypothetical protein
MKKISKVVTGAAAAAVMSVSFAAPADAQYRYRDRYDRGIDAGDIITGVAILGGIAAISSALQRDGYQYGYNNRYRYRDAYSQAVNACGYQAERYGRGGRISVTDVNRRGSGLRVRGVIDAGYNGGYGYDRGYGYDDRRYGYDNRRYGYGDRYSGYNRYGAQTVFTCHTDRYGRVRDFDVNRYRY